MSLYISQSGNCFLRVKQVVLYFHEAEFRQVSQLPASSSNNRLALCVNDRSKGISHMCSPGTCPLELLPFHEAWPVVAGCGL